MKAYVIMQAFGIAGAAVLISVFMGYGFTRILLPRHLEEHERLFYPFMGVSAIVIVSHLLGSAGLGSRPITWALLAVGSAVNLFALWKSGRRTVSPEGWLLPFLLSSPAFLLALLPQVLGGFLSVYSPNGDPAGYAILADYLLDNGLSPVPVGSHDEPQKQFLLFYYSRFAFPYFNSIIDYIFGLKAYQTFSVITAFALFLNALSIGLISRLLGIGRRAACLAVLLTSVNGYLLLMFFQGFAPQLLGMGFMGLSSVLLYAAFERQDNRSVLLASIFLSSAIAAYSDGLVFIGVPGFILFLWHLKAKGINTLYTAVKIGVLSLLINPAGALWAYRLTIWRMKVGLAGAGGNVGVFERLTAPFGLEPSVTIVDWMRQAAVDWTPAWGGVFPAFALVSLAFIAILSVYGIAKAGRRAGVYLLATALSYVVLTLLPYHYRMPYLYFKNLSITFYIFIVAFSAGIGVLFEDKLARPGAARAVAAAFTFSIIALNTANSLAVSRTFHRTSGIVSRDMSELASAAQSLNSGAAFYIPYEGGARQLWELYFLSGQKVHYGTNDGNGGMVTPFQSEKRGGDHFVKRYDLEAGIDYRLYKSVWSNKSYSIFSEREGVVAAIDNYSSRIFPIEAAPGAPLKMDFASGRVVINGNAIGVDASSSSGRPDKGIGIVMEYSAPEGGVLNAGPYRKALPPGMNKFTLDLPGPVPVSIESGSRFLVNRIALVESGGSPGSFVIEPREFISASSRLKDARIFTRMEFQASLEGEWTLSLDIYDSVNHTHPDGHFGWWTAALPHIAKGDSVEFVLDPRYKTATGRVGGKEAEFVGWAGPVNEGRYSALLVLRPAGKEYIARIMDAYDFELKDGKVANFTTVNSYYTIY